MKITAAKLEFSDLVEFTKFIDDNHLINVIQLSQPIKDNSGNILLKEKVPIKDNTLKKLNMLQGHYTPLFKVFITNELVERLKANLMKQVMPKVESSKSEFIKTLFQNDQSSISSYRDFISGSFYNSTLVLVLYRILLEKPEFFTHAIELALLCLGAVVQKTISIRFVHRFAFLAGLFADISLSETEYWKAPAPDDIQALRTAKISAEICKNLYLASPISKAIEDHPIMGMYIEIEKKQDPIDFTQVMRHPFLVNHTRDFGAEEQEVLDPATLEELNKIVRESLKIARFIKDTIYKIGSVENSAEKLIVMLTYNVEKGIFNKQVADPMIDRFKDYAKVVERIKKIAEVENKCKFPPSAWAYPKPNATQVICKNKVEDCPFYIRGWDLSVVTKQDALGYIGTALNPGVYPKCKLEEDIQAAIQKKNL